MSDLLREADRIAAVRKEDADRQKKLREQEEVRRSTLFKSAGRSFHHITRALDKQISQSSNLATKQQSRDNMRSANNITWTLDNTELIVDEPKQALSGMSSFDVIAYSVIEVRLPRSGDYKG